MTRNPFFPPGGSLEDCADVSARSIPRICEVAFADHLLHNPGAGVVCISEISESSWVAAIRAWRLEGGGSVAEAAARVVEWLARSPRTRIRGRDIQQFGPRPKLNAKQAHAVLELLETSGYLRRVSEHGARRPVYDVHPMFRGDAFKLPVTV